MPTDPRTTLAPDLTDAWTDLLADAIADFAEFGCDAIAEHPLPPARCKLGGEVQAALRREPVREEARA